jgi:hypothetical protein
VVLVAIELAEQRIVGYIERCKTAAAAVEILKKIIVAYIERSEIRIGITLYVSELGIVREIDGCKLTIEAVDPLKIVKAGEIQ